MKSLFTFAVVALAVYLAWRYLSRQSPSVPSSVAPAPIAPGGGIGGLCGVAGQVAGASYGVAVPPGAGAQVCGFVAPVATTIAHGVSAVARPVAHYAARGATYITHGIQSGVGGVTGLASTAAGGVSSALRSIF